MKHLKTALIIAALSTLGPFSTDTYFPSFPALAAHFHVSIIQVQSTLSFYLIALAMMNLFHGSLSDSFGRRSVIEVTLAVYIVSALACVVAPSFGWLLFLRVIQGLAAGAGMIVSRAMIRDLFHGVEAQQLMSQVAMLGGAGPIIAPIFGGWLHVWFGWRGPFVFLGLLGIALLCACRFGLPESLPTHLRHTFHPGKLSRAYLATLKNPAFLLSCFALAFGGGGFLLYVATAPDVVLNIFHLSETQFGWLFVPLISGLILGSAVGSKLMGRIPPARLVRLGFGLMAAGAAVNIAASLWLAPRVPWAVLPLTLYTFGFSFVAPVTTIEGLDMIPQRKGLAASLQGFTQILVFALISGFVARLVYHSGPKHAVGLTVLMGLSWLAYIGSKRFGSLPAKHGLAANRPGDDNPFKTIGNLDKQKQTCLDLKL
jgi:DHA1 family bicyclomycin/chloramphenicol resistance-like MFS transporter